MAMSALTARQTSDSAAAAEASQFNPGMIISDAQFYDGGAMTEDAVQSFLNAKQPSCSAGYTCLKSYHQDTASKATVAGRCSGYPGAVNESAAQIITKVGAACGISQKVLLVTLEKEEALVSSMAPSDARYKIAMGYGCPDTAACDTTYYGFFNQLWNAARQFKIYQTSPMSFNIQAGRVNQVRFSPNASCGTSSVFVQNSATAGLYNYTPYQPNAAALANLYGSGDGCSSYGNRNFWVLYTDWFGSTTLKSMVRTAADPTVYLLVNSIKYPVLSFPTYNAFASLGPASTVSQSYLDSLTTGHALGRIIRGSDSAIYYVDAGIKLQFTSCNLVVDYGGSCDPSGYVDMTDSQIASLHTGPYITSVFATQEGPRYYVSNGLKHEILDESSLNAAGISSAQVVLTESGLSGLAFGAPVMRDSVFVKEQETSNYYFLSEGHKYSVPSVDVSSMGAPTRTVGVLHAQSLAVIPSASTPFPGVFTVAGSSTVYLATASGKYALTVPALASAETPIAMSQSTADSYKDAGTVGVGSFVKSTTDDSVYLVTPTALRQVGGWAALVVIAGTSNMTITVVGTDAVGKLPKGGMVLTPGMMYRTRDNDQIYLLDGLGSKIPVGNFDYTTAAGFSTWTFASADHLGNYATSTANLTYGVRCGGAQYVSVSGILRPLTTTTAPLFPLSFVQLDPLTCAQTTIGAAAIDFIRTSDGSIYQLFSGQKHHVGSSTLTGLNAGKGWMEVPASFATLIPSGADV